MDTTFDVELTTERLLLRPLEIADVDLLWPHVTNPEITRYMAWAPHRDRAQTEAFVRNEVERLDAGRGATWAIVNGTEFCGIVSLIGVLRRHRDLTYDRGELAYWLGPAHQGQGLMTEAASRVLAFAFGELALHKVHVSHFGANRASEALIVRLGMRYVGEQREEFQKEGRWHHHRLYEMLASEYAAFSKSMAARGLARDARESAPASGIPTR